MTIPKVSLTVKEVVYNGGVKPPPSSGEHDAFLSGVVRESEFGEVHFISLKRATSVVIKSFTNFMVS